MSISKLGVEYGLLYAEKMTLDEQSKFAWFLENSEADLAVQDIRKLAEAIKPGITELI